jgi:hypothetical protein
MAIMRGPLRLPDFSVVVWIKQNENFGAVRSELLAAVEAEPYETTEYQGMADFHFATNSMADAHKLTEALKAVSERPEVVVVRIMSLVDGVESISIKDERVTKH